MKKRVLLKSLMALSMASAIGMTQAQAEPLKVGFIYVGPIGDHGWTYQHNEGRKAIETAFGSGVETTYVENVSEGADATRAIEKLARSGHDLIFTTSFGYMNPTIKVAKKFPKVKFEHATGYKRAKNVSTYSARFYEGRYAVGKIVGNMTKTNVIGYIASFPIPEVIRGINATAISARSVNPDAVVKVVWVNTWYDPGKESDAAKVLIDQGADIILQHTDSPAPLTVAEANGVYAIGQASDMVKFAPKAQLTAIIDDWSEYYVARTKAVMDGSWESQDVWDGFKEGMVKLADYSPMIPADVAQLSEETRVGIENGSILPFAGPIYKQNGELLIPEGEALDDGVLAGMDFYVQGVEGELPK